MAKKSEEKKPKTSTSGTAGKSSTRKKQTPKKQAAKKKTVTKKEPEEVKTNAKAEPKAEPQEDQTTEERLRKAGDRLSDAADRGVEVLRDVFGKVKDFSVDAAELTRLKVDIYRLKGDRDRMLTIIGEKLWEMRDSDKMKGIKSLFEEDFQKLEELHKDIEKKEKTASKISL